MVQKSRTDIYEFIYGLLYGAVTENVYYMDEPTELTESDVADGFIVINVGEIMDESEFSCEAYGWCRVFVQAFVPPMSRGRVDISKYSAFENDINNAISSEVAISTSDTYSIQEDSVISLDGRTNANANNDFYMFVKSFIVTIE